MQALATNVTTDKSTVVFGDKIEFGDRMRFAAVVVAALIAAMSWVDGDWWFYLMELVFLVVLLCLLGVYRWVRIELAEQRVVVTYLLFNKIRIWSRARLFEDIKCIEVCSIKQVFRNELVCRIALLPRAGRRVILDYFHQIDTGAKDRAIEVARRLTRSTGLPIEQNSVWE